MIKLSYSSISNLYNGHEWLNKQLGIPVPDYPFLKEGKEAHRIIQDHVSGKIKNEFLKHIEINFPIVEEKDFDERCKFTIPIGDKYLVSGFIDGIDIKNDRFLEIKTSSKPWSMTQFRDAMQRKIYALSNPKFKEAYIITGSKNPSVWEKEPPKIYSLSLTQKDRDEALDWIRGGILILESGKFTGGLDENGKCTGCFWNMDRYQNLANCHFQ
jgi:hypothetical protein